MVDGVTHKAIVIAINNREYTFDNNYGYLLRGFFSYEKDNWFYYWMDEAVNNGWFDVDGETYYAYPDGHLATGSHVIDGKAYMFNERGQLIRDGLRLFVTVNADNTLMTITTSETTGLSNVRMAVWSNASNQADLQWFEAKVDEKGQWSVTVPLCQYEKTGIYQIHTYGVNAEGTDGLLVTTTTNVAKTAQHIAGEAEKVITKEPDCIATGSYDLIVHCTLCGEVLSITTESIDALGHKPGTPVAENATEGACIQGGTYESVVYCSVCKAELSRETVTIPADGHKPGEAVKENEVLPTCTTAGSYDMVTYCTVCHEELTRETTAVDALGHKPGEAVKENEVLPTCTTDGSYESVVYCSVCEEELNRETVTVESEGHTYGEATRANVIEPTCTVNGSYDKVIRCTVCNEILETKHVVLPASGHVDADEDGNCDVCDKDLNGDEEEELIETIAMQRLYNPNTGEHFYTGSEEERDMLVEAGWNYEGIAWHAPVKVGAPIYRVYNPNSGDHHYTGSEVERDHLVSLGWQYEGVAWNTLGQTNSPQYRLYNPNADIGSHHYTGSEEERDYLVSLGWKYEGIAWYGCDKANPIEQ